MITVQTASGNTVRQSCRHAGFAALAFLVLLIAAAPARAGFISLYGYVHGANSSVVAELGQVSYITGCPPGGIDDFMYGFADVHIVPKMSRGPGSGSTLTDVSNAQGTPNTLYCIIMDEVLSNTAPGGLLPSGDYAVVMDDCQDGKFQPGIDFYGEEFLVRIPANVDPLESAAFAAQLAATNAAATAQQQSWTNATAHMSAIFACNSALTFISICTGLEA